MEDSLINETLKWLEVGKCKLTSRQHGLQIIKVVMHLPTTQLFFSS